MTQLEKVTANVAKLDFSKFPAELAPTINAKGWMASLLGGAVYKEPDPEYLLKLLMAQSILADTIEQAWELGTVRHLQDWLPNEPGAVLGPFEITDIYVAKSDFETGNPTYVIVSCVMLDTGEEERWSTGASQIQATLLGLLRHGVWPIQAKLLRGDIRDKGDRYMMNMVRPD